MSQCRYGHQSEDEFLYCVLCDGHEGPCFDYKQELFDNGVVRYNKGKHARPDIYFGTAAAPEFDS